MENGFKGKELLSNVCNLIANRQALRNLLIVQSVVACQCLRLQIANFHGFLDLVT